MRGKLVSKMLEKLGHRIAIIGPTCSGKSTLAVRLAEQAGLPVYHLDKINWLNDKPNPDFETALADWVNAKHWIIEGVYLKALPVLLKHADSLIYLDYARMLCASRLLRRGIAEQFGRRQVGNNNDSRHSLSPALFSFVLSNYPATKKPAIDRLLAETSVPVFRFQTPRQLRQLFG